MKAKKSIWLDRTVVYGPYLCLCLNQADIDEACKQLGAPPQPQPKLDACVIVMEKGSKLSCIVCLKDIEGQHYISVMAMVVHESVHVFQNMCEKMGEDSPSEEFEAYSIQNITQTLFEALEKRIEIDAKGIIKIK